MDDMVYDYYIGLDKDNAPVRFLYAFSLLGMAISAVLFIIFMYNSYVSQTTQLYVSLEQSANSICQSVGIQFTGTYTASDEGYWSLDNNYHADRGLYAFTFSNIEFKDLVDFKKFMNSDFYQFKTLISNVTSVSTLSQNLLYMMLFMGIVDTGGYLQLFQLTANPVNVFDNAYFMAVYGGGNGTNNEGCPLSASVEYDRINGVFQVYWLAANIANCIDPRYLGYTSASEGKELIFNIDSTSLTSAVAVASNVIDSTYFLTVRHLRNFEFRGALYSADLQVNINVYKMKVILCLTRLEGYDTISAHPIDTMYCFLHVNQQGVYAPVIGMFTEYGYYSAETEEYEACTCPMTSAQQNCNQFQFITGVITFPNTYNSTSGTFNENASYYAAMDLVSRYTEVELRTHYHQAAVDILSGSQEADFGFCDYNCTMLAIHTEDFKSAYSVNSFYYQLINGSCRDVLEDDNWDKLLTTTPTVLTESYYSCVYKPFTALINSAGIAENIVEFVMPFILIGLFILLTMIELSGYFPKSPEKYSLAETSETLEKFAHMLLEGKKDGLHFPNMHSVVQEIATEVKNQVIVIKESKSD